MADKPKIHTTLAKLNEDTKAPPEPFKVGLSDSSVITFPDMYGGDQDAEWTERVLHEINRRDRVAAWPVLNAWLSKEDAEKLKGEKLNFQQLTKLIAAASAHYDNHYGSLGEGTGSDD